MKLKIWYSIQNGGDGSAYPRWMESEELARWDQDNMDEGWGESCCGYIEVESDSKITVIDQLTTVEDMIKERQHDLDWAIKYPSSWTNPAAIQKEIDELEAMKKNQ